MGRVRHRQLRTRMKRREEIPQRVMIYHFPERTLQSLHRLIQVLQILDPHLMDLLLLQSLKVLPQPSQLLRLTYLINSHLIY